MLCFFGFLPWLVFILILSLPIWLTIIAVIAAIAALVGWAPGGGGHSGEHYHEHTNLLTGSKHYDHYDEHGRFIDRHDHLP